MPMVEIDVVTLVVIAGSSASPSDIFREVDELKNIFL
jgi:hypothetical protein